MHYLVSYLFRSLGSVVGVSIGSSLVQVALRDGLKARLSGDNVDEVSCVHIIDHSCVSPFTQIIRRVRESLKHIDELDPSTQAVVRSSYEHAIHVSLWFSVTLAAGGALFSLFIREVPLESKKICTVDE